MKKSVMTCASLLLVCLWLTSSAQATLIQGDDDWKQPLEAGQTVTCVAHFIPDVPAIVPDSLIFVQAPEWTLTWPFDYATYGWDTAISEDGKAAYLYGPALTNDTLQAWQLFSYSLFYQWDDEDPHYNENNPVWVDVAVFSGQELFEDGAVRGIPGGPWDHYYSDTWRETYVSGSDPYENPIPEPVTICLLGLGVAFLRKRR
ncbi:MAG: hypothetical protein ACYS0C_06195 [Planctomycetota bacterium]|jgi:hypothetical protein